MSDLASVERAVVNILSDVLNEPADRLREQPVLAVHEWDSVASLEALSQLESQLGVTLDLRSYHNARTIDDLVSLARDAGAVAAATGQRQ